jgi:DNA 3'-phosphatase
MFIQDNEKRILYYQRSQKIKYKKLACFDLDHTFITTKSGNTFPKNADDWILFNNTVENKIKELIKQKYQIVIFSNQSNMDKSEKKYSDFIDKFNNINKIFNNKIELVVAFGKNEYRKPDIGMWEFYTKNRNVDIEKSFYVGDAAGRKNDFSDSDKKFAENIGISFHLPDDFFI